MTIRFIPDPLTPAHWARAARALTTFPDLLADVRQGGIRLEVSGEDIYGECIIEVAEDDDDETILVVLAQERAPGRPGQSWRVQWTEGVQAADPADRITRSGPPGPFYDLALAVLLKVIPRLTVFDAPASVRRGSLREVLGQRRTPAR